MDAKICLIMVLDPYDLKKREIIAKKASRSSENTRKSGFVVVSILSCQEMEKKKPHTVKTPNSAMKKKETPVARCKELIQFMPF